LARDFLMGRRLSLQKQNESFAIDVDPGELHFNSAHFITFGGSCENLHGHNFHVRLQARGGNTSDAFVIDFVLLNRLAAEVCAQLNDKVLVPGRSKEVNLREDGDRIQVSSYGKEFTLPASNCAVLPVPNTTAEMLAWHILESLLPRLEAHSALANVAELQVAVEEADHQWGIYRRSLDTGVAAHERA
jgi:6-pyruvoyltetrahydropterin/6-carboxytetrahydropterin synthase